MACDVVVDIAVGLGDEVSEDGVISSSNVWRDVTFTEKWVTVSAFMYGYSHITFIDFSFRASTSSSSG